MPRDETEWARAVIYLLVRYVGFYPENICYKMKQLIRRHVSGTGSKELKCKKGKKGLGRIRFSALLQKDQPFLVLDSSEYAIIFWLLWLKTHKPLISWSDCEILSWFPLLSPKLSSFPKCICLFDYYWESWVPHSCIYSSGVLWSQKIQKI